MTSLDNYGVFTYATTKATRTSNALSDYLLGLPQQVRTGHRRIRRGQLLELRPLRAGRLAHPSQPDTSTLACVTTGSRLPTDPQNRQTNFVPGVQSHAFKNVTIAGKTGYAAGARWYALPGRPRRSHLRSIYSL